MSHVKTNRFLLALISIVLCLLFMLFALPFSASAKTYISTDQYIELDGTFTGTFDLSTNTSQLFYIKDMVPGDSWVGTIHVKNSAPDKMDFAVVSVVSDLEDTLLFDTLITKMVINGESVYEGSYGFESSEEYMTKFYTLRPGDVLEIDVEVSLPETVGNELMGKEMDSTWIFEAIYYGSLITDDPAPTGYDLIMENISNSPWLIMTFLAISAAIFVYIRILVLKNKQRDIEKKTND